MDKPIRVLSKSGQIFIPPEIRNAAGFSYGDIISFEALDGVVIMRREILQNDSDEPRIEVSLTSFLDNLSPDERWGLLKELLQNMNEKGDITCE